MKCRYYDGYIDGLNSWEEKIKINIWLYKFLEELVLDFGDDELFWKKMFV